MNVRIGIGCVGVALLLAGCNDKTLVPIPSTRSEVRFQEAEQTTAPKVDLLWVIDDSGSMGDEQARLASSFQAFADRSAELGIDFRMAVISADPRSSASGRFVGNPAVLDAQTPDLAQAFLERAMLGTDGGSREAGLQTAMRALREPMLNGPNAGFLRPDAVLALVFLSDEDDQSMAEGSPEPPDSTLDDPEWRDGNLVPLQELVDFFLQVKGGDPEKLFGVAIIGDPVGDPYAGENFEFTGCDLSPGDGNPDARGGFRYAAATAAMGGFWRSICGGEEHFRTILEDVASEVPQTVLRKEFATDFEPIPGTVNVTVDGVPVVEDPVTGWHWVPGVGVVFSDAAVPPACARIEITYGLPPGPGGAATQDEPPPGCLP